MAMDLSVTNDAAEKGVRNAQEAALSSKSESRRECNMLVQNMQRAKCPAYNRDNLSNSYCNCFIVNLNRTGDFRTNLPYFLHLCPLYVKNNKIKSTKTP